MGTVLLYNFKDTERRVAVMLSVLRLGLTAREVAPEEFSHPLGFLLGLEGFAPAAVSGPAFAEEMLVMYGLSGQQFSGLLDALRGSVPVALKAVVTETNVSWSSARLRKELAAEHAAMQKRGRSRPKRT